MEPQTRYVTSADGTRIALWTLGQGRPLIFVPAVWICSMESHRQVPQIRKNFERLALRRTLVQFDHRGLGLSDREVVDFSLEARLSDLAAVVDHLGAAEADLLGEANGGAIAIAYAVRNP